MINKIMIILLCLIIGKPIFAKVQNRCYLNYSDKMVINSSRNKKLKLSNINFPLEIEKMSFVYPDMVKFKSPSIKACKKKTCTVKASEVNSKIILKDVEDPTKTAINPDCPAPKTSPQTKKDIFNCGDLSSSIGIIKRIKELRYKKIKKFKLKFNPPLNKCLNDYSPWKNLCVSFLKGNKKANMPSIFSLCGRMGDRTLRTLSRVEKSNEIQKAVKEIKEMKGGNRYDGISPAVVTCLIARETALTYAPNMIDYGNCSLKRSRIFFSNNLGQFLIQSFLYYFGVNDSVRGSSLYPSRVLRHQFDIRTDIKTAPRKRKQNLTTPLKDLSKHSNKYCKDMLIKKIETSYDPEKSKLVDYDSLSGLELYDYLSLNYKFQAEFIMCLLKIKGTIRKKGKKGTKFDLNVALRGYNGNKEKINNKMGLTHYYKKINSCKKCINTCNEKGDCLKQQKKCLGKSMGYYK